VRIPAQAPTGGWRLGRELGGAEILLHFCVRKMAADCDGSSLAPPLSGLRRRMHKLFKLPGRPWVSCTPSTLTLSRLRGPSSWSCRDSYQYVLPQPRGSYALELTVSFVFAGRFVGAGSDRGDVQSDGRHLVPEFQVLVHDLDAGQGRQLFEAAEGRERDKRVR
jgi:hypothetical protein